MSEQMPQFESIEQMTYRNGANHIYGVDEVGKKQHLSHDAVLEAHGYSADEAKQAQAEFGAPELATNDAAHVSEVENMQQPEQTAADDEHNLYAGIDKLKAEVEGLTSQRKEHAKWQMKVDTAGDKPSKSELTTDDIAYSMWLEENARQETDSRSVRDVIQEKQAAIERERMKASANLGMRVKTGQATGEEAAYYYTLKEADENQRSEQPQSSEETEKPLEQLTMSELLDELAFAEITGDRERQHELHGVFNAKKEEAYKDLSDEEKQAKDLELTNEFKDRIVHNLLAVDSFDGITDEQREHARQYGERFKNDELHFLEELTRQQRELYEQSGLSEEELDEKNAFIEEQFNRGLDRYALLAGLSEDDKAALRKDIADRILRNEGAHAEDGEAQASQEEVPPSLVNRLKDRIRKVLNRDGGGAEAINTPERDDPKRQAKRTLGIAAGVLAGIALLSLAANVLDDDGTKASVETTTTTEASDDTEDGSGTLAGAESDDAQLSAEELQEKIDAFNDPVPSNEGISHLSQRIGIDFGQDADRWNLYNQGASNILRGLDGTYERGGIVYLNEGAQVNPSPEQIQQLLDLAEEVKNK